MSACNIGWIWSQPDLTAKARLLLLALNEFANAQHGDWRVYPSAARLEKLTGLSSMSRKRAMQELQERGLIRVEAQYDDDGRRTTNMIWIMAPFIGEPAQHDHPEHRGEGTKLVRGGGDQIDPPEGTKLVHKPPNKNPGDMTLRAGEGIAGWEDWVEYRKQARKKMTEATVKRQVAQLKDLSAEQQRATIETSIRNGWTGLFPERQSTAGGSHHARNQDAGQQGRRTSSAAGRVRENAERARAEARRYSGGDC